MTTSVPRKVIRTGWKSSGLGARLGGAQGIRKYCRQQAITTPRVPRMENQLLWYPYSHWRGRIVAALLRLFVARNVQRRLRRAGSRNRGHASLVSGAK
jgi:hypothetical protein